MTTFPSKALRDELLRGELWHCTKPELLKSIWKDQSLRPRCAPTSRTYSASHYLNGISLFDWSRAGDDEQFAGAKSKQFFDFGIAIGLEPSKLPGRLVYYPETRDSTSEEATGKRIQGPIPDVEVIHIGPIPYAAATRILVFHLRSSSNFSVIPAHDNQRLLQAIEASARNSRPQP